MRLLHRILGISSLVISAAAAAQSWAPASRLDAYFLEKNALVSGSFAVSARGVVRYRRSVGFATIDNGVPQPADNSTRYRIGPVSQLFTAALVLQFAERGTITLDNPLAEFFPDEPDAMKITYREMLRVQHGSAEYNYLLLGRMLEKVAERSYADILVRHIAGKLGLARTYCAGSGTAMTLEADSYHWTPEGWRASEGPDQTTGGGATGIVSNAGDLVAFMDALFTGSVVTPHSLSSMRGDDGSPAIGLTRTTFAGVTGFCARGGIDSFEAAVCHFPDHKTSIAWTGNAARVSLDQILDETTKILFSRAR